LVAKSPLTTALNPNSTAIFTAISRLNEVVPDGTDAGKSSWDEGCQSRVGKKGFKRPCEHCRSQSEPI